MDIPTLSLVVAALAVFVGPLTGWLVARAQIRAASCQATEQISATLLVANKQIVAPMRQAWINSLRDLLAELLSSLMHYYLAGFEDRSDLEYKQLQMLEHKLQLMLNPKEEDHVRLEDTIRDMVLALQSEPGFSPAFMEHHSDATRRARAVLKREWDRVKDPLVIAAGPNNSSKPTPLRGAA